MQQRRSTFHDGERAVQARAGVSGEWLNRSESFVRSEMPQQHRSFFENLQMLILGLLDSDGRPWCVPVLGPRGFLVSPTPDTLEIHRDPVLLSELGLVRSVGASVGILGIDLTSRRRNRLNGRIQHASPGEMTIVVDQSYGNCPQYIQTRHLPSGQDKLAVVARRRGSITDPEVRRIIEAADTFFIASRAAGSLDGGSAGVDASHRGGTLDFLVSTEMARSPFPISLAIAFSTHWATLRVMAGSACLFRILKRVKQLCLRGAVPSTGTPNASRRSKVRNVL
jgi:predicted pyridoxine 5'-phosphate oxidase superfamily flavin-nucleotide-binding protein